MNKEPDLEEAYQHYLTDTKQSPLARIFHKKAQTSCKSLRE